jgi:hypothetical protein
MRCCRGGYELHLSLPTYGKFRVHNVVVVKQGTRNIYVGAHVIASTHSSLDARSERMRTLIPYAELMYTSRRLARGKLRYVAVRVCRYLRQRVESDAMLFFAELRREDSPLFLPIDLRRLVWNHLFAFVRSHTHTRAID